MADTLTPVFPTLRCNIIDPFEDILDPTRKTEKRSVINPSLGTQQRITAYAGHPI
jgi:hypothetical protein